MWTVLTTAEILDRCLGEEHVPVRETWRNPYPLSERVLPVCWHLIRDCLPESRRTLSDIEDDIDHVAAQGSNELAHVGIPLEVQAADRAGPRPALVGLGKLDAIQERGERTRSNITGAKRLREIAPLVTESGKPDHFDRGYREGHDIDDFHLPAP